MMYDSSNQGIFDSEDKDELNIKAIQYWYGKFRSSYNTDGECIVAVAEDLCINIDDVIRAVG